MYHHRQKQFFVPVKFFEHKEQIRCVRHLAKIFKALNLRSRSNLRSPLGGGESIIFTLDGFNKATIPQKNRSENMAQKFNVRI